MKIVYLGRYNESEILTGPEKVAKRIFHNMNKINSDCVFVEYFFDGAKYSIWKKLFGMEKMADGNFEIYRLGLFRIFFFLIISKPEIIHIITFERFAFVAFIYRLFRKVKIYYTVHGIITHEDGLKRIRRLKSFYLLKNKIVELLVFTKSTNLIFLSQVSIVNAKKYYNFDQKKISIIPNGVDDIFIHNYKNKVYNDSEIKAVFVGDYSRPEKGLEKLLEVLREIYFKMELHIISDSEIKKNLTYMNLDVIFHKKYDLNGFANFLLDKDIFISASKYDQFSIAALEGVASGLVPFFTIETGLSELTSEVDCGFYFSYQEMYKIKDFLEQFQRNKKVQFDKIHDLHKILQEFSWDSIARRYLQLYEA